MSKSSKKTPAPRKAAQSQSTGAAGRTAGRSTVSRRHSGKPEFEVNLQAIRNIAIVLGALLLVGLIAMVAQLGGEYTPNAIITVLLVVLLIGLSAYAAARTEDFLRFFHRFTR